MANSLQSTLGRALDQERIASFKSNLIADGSTITMTKLTVDSQERGDKDVPTDYFHAVITDPSGSSKKARIPVAEFLRMELAEGEGHYVQSEGSDVITYAGSVKVTGATPRTDRNDKVIFPLGAYKNTAVQAFLKDVGADNAWDTLQNNLKADHAFAPVQNYSIELS
jgi:hypothetical protein